MDSRDYPEAYLTDELESYGTMNHAIDKAAARIKKLEAENARLREELAAAESLRAGQQKFYVSAVQDAKRYRWLRENLNNTEALEELYKHPGDVPTAEQFDAAIDDAIAKENGK